MAEGSSDNQPPQWQYRPPWKVRILIAAVISMIFLAMIGSFLGGALVGRYLFGEGWGAVIGAAIGVLCWTWIYSHYFQGESFIETGCLSIIIGTGAIILANELEHQNFFQRLLELLG